MPALAAHILKLEIPSDVIFTTRISNLYLLLFSSDDEEEEEEMLISEEEIPFKDDPRDETYKPHLERYVSFYSRHVCENKFGKHCCMFLFPLVAMLLVGIDLILSG